MNAPNVTDWIVAVASSFAAVGTVGAVVVALWQTRRQQQRRVHVECRLGVTPDERLICLRAINDGPKAVEITMAYAQTNDARKVVSHFVPGLGDQLPKLLLEGESAEVFWRQAALAQVREELNFDGYWYAFVTDTLGNVFCDTFPGTKKKHKLTWTWPWVPVRRRVVYELPPADRDPLTM